MNWLLYFTSLAFSTQYAIASSTAGTLQLDFHGMESSVHPNPRSFDNLHKRAGILEVTLENLYTYYNVHIDLGTPRQTFNLLIDTGSSDMWVIGQTNKYCYQSKQDTTNPDKFDCTVSGTYNLNTSTSFVKNNTDFYIKYGDGTIAQGDWAMDVLNFHGQKIENMSFGVGHVTNSSMGVLGIGYESNEATNTLKNPYTYANLPVKLAQQGVINTPSYSLWLNDINAKKGSLLFGGVDHAKYIGNLVRIPILKGTSDGPRPSAFLVAFDSLKMTDGTGLSREMMTKPVEALLDSGTSLTYLPSDLAKSTLVAMNAVYNRQIGYYIQSCNLQGSLNYTFSGAKINVPFSSILLPIKTRSGATATFRNGDPVCAIGIVPASYPFALLGDTFLRNAYVVYDLKNDEIAIAQCRHNTNESNIEAITDTIPNSQLMQFYAEPEKGTMSSFSPSEILENSGSGFDDSNFAKTPGAARMAAGSTPIAKSAAISLKIDMLLPKYLTICFIMFISANCVL